MPKTNSRKLRNYEHQDFNALLSELKNEKPAETDFQAEAEEKKKAAKAAVPKSEKQVFSLYRQRIFSNENVNYIYSVSENILHEKHCLYVKAITDEELRYSETYLSNMRQCPACAAESYLRIGAKDPENSEHYKRIFELCGITQKQLRNMYLVKGMKTRISGSGFLISYKKDTWKIRLLSENGHVQLLHNNYRVLQNGQRQFVQGFHVQNPSCEDTNFGYALGLIRNYDYSPENAAKHTLKGDACISGRRADVSPSSGEERIEKVQGPKRQGQDATREENSQTEQKITRRCAEVKEWFRKIFQKLFI